MAVMENGLERTTHFVKVNHLHVSLMLPFLIMVSLVYY